MDTQFLDTATFRKSYAELVRTKADLSDFDCYACHDKGKPPTLRFDAQQNLIIPKEHADIVMGHGSHDRNNNCFNCHNEQNLELLQTRDGRQVKFADSPPLCGSCHGPTYRDWEAGAHGRTSGYWDRSAGPDEAPDLRGLPRSAPSQNPAAQAGPRPASAAPGGRGWPPTLRTDMPPSTSNPDPANRPGSRRADPPQLSAHLGRCLPPAWRRWPPA